MLDRRISAKPRIVFVISFILCALGAIPLRALPAASAQPTYPLVILSPGHGWAASTGGPIDSGAVRGDLIEKDINLDVARLTRTRLARCPVNVVLTRTADDASHTLEDVDEIVNFYQPALGVSIHSNGSENPAASGTEAWYTVNGLSGDDSQSQRLATLLADQVAADLALTNQGSKPETDNRLGGLYIHWWQAPSALIELGYLDGDGDLLRRRRADFASAIARAILDYLNMPVDCLNGAVPGTPGTPIPQKAFIDGFGIMSPHIQVGTQGLTTALDAQKRMGVRWAREEIPWELVEANQQAFRWQYHFNSEIDHDFDRLLSELNTRGIKLVAVLNYGPRYLTGNPFHGYQVNPSDLLARWQVYVQAVVDRFGDRIDYWEIGNEMNSRTFWGKVVTETTDPNGRDIPADPDPILYAHMLRIAHDIIKQHDRNDTVILGGLAGYYGDLTNCRSNYQKYLADLHDVGAWDAFDVAAIHPYHNSPDEQGFAPDEFIQRGLRYNLSTQACEATTASLSLLAEVRGVFELINRLGPKPLWITEVGWKQNWLEQWAATQGVSADSLEAAYLVRTFVPLLSEAGLEKVFWYTQTNLEDPTFDLGVPGQRALGNLSALLTNSQPLGQVQGQDDYGRPDDDDVHEYRFVRDDQQIVVLWKARGGMATRDVVVRNIDSDAVRLYPIDALDLSATGGSPLAVSNDSVTVTLNENPVFLVITSRGSWDTFWRDLRARVESWWQNTQGSIGDWWAEQQTKLTRWWEEQRAAVERQVAQWLDDVQRQIEEAVQQQIEEALNQLCGAAFVLPSGLVIVAWWLRQRGHWG